MQPHIKGYKNPGIGGYEVLDINAMQIKETNIQLLKEIAYYVHHTILRNEKIKKELEELRGETKMSFIDLIIEEKEKIMSEGRLKGKEEGKEASIRSIVKEMLKCHTDDKFIMQVTKIDQKMLDQIKAQLQKV